VSKKEFSIQLNSFLFYRVANALFGEERPIKILGKENAENPSISTFSDLSL